MDKIAKRSQIPMTVLAPT